MEPTVQGWCAAALLTTGVVFMVLGAVGVVRMPDLYLRVQAATKTATLGLWTVFIAVAVHFGDVSIVAAAVVVIVLALLTVPVAAHAITRAAHGAGVPLWPEGVSDDLARDARQRAHGEEEPQRSGVDGEGPAPGPAASSPPS